MLKRLILTVMLVLFTLPLAAVEPEEVLSDPVLESRARELSKGLRCLVCRNESIDESNADLARDLRILVRERLVAGDSDEEVIAYLVDRYGEYVLLNPTTKGANLLLWIAAPLALFLALAGALYYVIRRSRAPTVDQTLSDGEKARLDQILNG
ncbi:cytochrome C biogenesis protein CcdA [Brevirhabdus pacifica]|uniref:Cytochrome c-type biogenesis protein n=1 Tax=Brevirhabdus pacifica TaxID=1267768 RepID=A0A1U7DFZ2_9RHOB|nr:cytochrome c-type biogenesis protein [Brevirhabdus pacifica]APX88798.1 cytochrome C biogenesis protein CcdA [Brevirhabdus pacifica]OWU80049.1 cytochrome C biogenesis protein CcdA [Loktanella sp. 22II-4b]PJJ86672.1 cytochrome c-type biogenesis protein CcmH [Brevirhabdus pacifica]